jgi:hypothetical protein
MISSALKAEQSSILSTVVKMANSEVSENKKRMAKGELYIAFTPELEADRARCKDLVSRYNAAVATRSSRREIVRLWRE